MRAWATTSIGTSGWRGGCVRMAVVAGVLSHATGIAKASVYGEVPPKVEMHPQQEATSRSDLSLTDRDESRVASTNGQHLPPPNAGQIDDQVQMAVDMATASHPSIAAARAAARAAGADLGAAKWQRFPSVSVEGLLLDERANRLDSQVVVDQPIWTGGRISGAIHGARAREDAAEAAFDEAVQSVALAVVQSYYDVYRFRERGRLLEESLKRHQDMVATMVRRVAQDVSPLADLELARTRTLQIEQQLIQARAQAQASLQALRELVGDPGFEPRMVIAMPATWPDVGQDALFETAAVFDPRLRRLKFQAEAASADARVARASIFPQLSGQYRYSDVTGHRAGLVITAQTGGGLSRFESAEAARLRQQSSELQLSAAQRDLRNVLMSDLQEYTSSRARSSNGAEAAGSAFKVMESYIRQFASGRRSWLDVMNAVREATSAELDALDASIGTAAVYARILIRSGAWRPETREAGQ